MIPKMMKAYQVTGKNQGEVKEIPVPELQDESAILIKNDGAIICNMTDTHIYEGVHEPNGPTGWDMPLPFTLGHESSGIVVKVGKSVADVKVGDRVALAGFFESGSFAEYTAAKAGYIKIPQSFKPEEGALLEMISAVYLIIDQVFTIGESVALLGCGAAGSIALKYVKAGGATKVIVVEPHEEKRKYALENGADFVIDPDTEDVKDKMSEYTNSKMVDSVMEFSGAPKSLAVMTSLVRRSGRIGMFGVCPEPTLVNMYDLHMNWSSIVAAGYKRGYTEYVIDKALEMVESKVFDASKLITHRIKIEDVNNALHMIQEGKENIRKILIEF